MIDDSSMTIFGQRKEGVPPSNISWYRSPGMIYLATIFMVAIAYYATGRLGLVLAIPPGYATAIWPPSGIALAAVLLFSYRVWPGIVLGSFCLNIWTAIGPTYVFSPNAIALAVVIACGATIQATVSGYWVRSQQGFSNTLEQPTDIAILLFYGGILGCVINATISSLYLILAGVLSVSALPYHWWTWWVGDTVGVLIFTPLILLWAQIHKRENLGRLLLTTIPLVVTFLLVLLIFTHAKSLANVRMSPEAAEKTWRPWSVLAGGLLFTGSIWALMLVMTGRNAQLQAVNRRLRESELRLGQALDTLQKKSRILDLVTLAQARYSSVHNAQEAFEGVLKDLISITESEYGFIAELNTTERQTPFLRMHAVHTLQWGEEIRNLSEGKSLVTGLELHQIDSLLLRPIVRGAFVIENAIADHSTFSTLARGSLPTKTFLGMPLYAKERLIGVAVVANRNGGYTDEQYEMLVPLLQTISYLLMVYRLETKDMPQGS